MLHLKERVNQVERAAEVERIVAGHVSINQI